MKPPQWIKRHRSLYLPARAAALSLLGPHRFYTPLSAASLYSAERDDLTREILGRLRPIRREEGLSIWSTPWGEIATMESEMAEHLAVLLCEFRDKPYFAGPVAIGSGAIVLDSGANIGLFAQQALAAGAARVVCLEPSPRTARALRWNLTRPAATGQATILEKGAWDRAAALPMTVDPKRPGRSSFVNSPPEETAYQVTVAVETIDQIVRELSLPRVDFIKMDIEGAEVRALAGALETLRRDRPHLAIAVEHTARPLQNAKAVRDLVMDLDLGYHWRPGRYFVDASRRLTPEILYFARNGF